MKRFFAIILASLLIIGILVVPAAAAWTYRQQTANDVLYAVRTTLGYSDSASVYGAAMADLYAKEVNGDSSVNGDFFYSSRTGTVYFMDGTSKYVGTGYAIGGGKTDTSNTGKNYAGYDYSYSGKNLYAGIITGIDNYTSVNTEQANLLAKMLVSSVKSEKDLTKQAGVAWSVLYCAGGPSNLSDQKLKSTYSWYNSNITNYTDDNGRDLLALAKDVIFRYNAWKNGNTYVGRVLPSDYSWLCYYNNGTTTCRNSQNGADYTFPYMLPSSKNELRTPYSEK